MSPTLPLRYGKVVLPPSAEASTGPNALAWINPKVTRTYWSFL